MRYTQSILFGSACPRALALKALGYRKEKQSSSMLLGSALHHAVETGDDSAIRFLDSDQDTAVALACYRKFVDMFGELHKKDGILQEVFFELDIPHTRDSFAGVIDLLTRETICDLKTWSAHRLPDLNQWLRLSPQLWSYLWAVWKITGKILRASVIAVVKPQHRLKIGESCEEFVDRVWSHIDIQIGFMPAPSELDLLRFQDTLVLRSNLLSFNLKQISHERRPFCEDLAIVSGDTSQCFGSYPCDYVPLCSGIRSHNVIATSCASPELNREFKHVLTRDVFDKMEVNDDDLQVSNVA